MNRTRDILIIGVLGVFCILFFIFVYLPAHDDAKGTTKSAQKLKPSPKLLDEPVKKVPTFSFPAHSGETVDNAFFEGKVYVTDFFFTRCAEACPKMTAQLARVQERFPNPGNFRILSHTLDPDRDSIPVLQRYADKYGAQEGFWYFVTGDKKDIYDIGKKGYYQTVIDENESFINHSSKFVLVDEEGMIRGFYEGLDSAEVDMMMKDVKDLLYKER